MLTKKDLALNDSYLIDLVQSSRRKDMSEYNDFAPLSNAVMRTRNIIEQQQAQEEPAFNLITKIAFKLVCRCGFSWTYQPRQYDPKRKYALCPKCRSAVKIHPEQPVRRNRKTREVST